FRFGKEPVHLAARTETDRGASNTNKAFARKGDADRYLGTMGEAISLRVPNLPAQARQGRETD
ncbi:hypothetical protein, partial [Mesorhizobium sp. LNHC229A00]|uniref:hypothetical protein n=1 Tax=Mesorhizobium sp. LNHC229A00 TaxID=1287240 RepID=UPI0005188EF2